MAEPNSLLVVAIVPATLGAIFLVLRAVAVWSAPPSTGPQRPLPMFASPEAAAGTGTRSDGDGDRGKGERRRWGRAGDNEF